MKPDVEYCHKCDTETRWEPTRGGKNLRCQGGCKDLFPCRRLCEHLDCLQERAAR